MQPARDAYSAGDYTSAERSVSELVAAGSSNTHLYQLEHGITQLATGAPDPALASWRAARDQLDSLEGRGFLEQLGSWLSDDNALDYEGAAFERVLVRALLAVAELIAPDRQFGDDAIAYANQVSEVQAKIIAELQQEQSDLGGQALVAADAAFKFVAFGSYMISIIREADPLTADEASFQMKRVAEIEPGRTWLQDELARIEGRRFAAPGKGVVHVLGLVGRGPFRVQGAVKGTRRAIQLAQLIIAAMSRSWPEISLTDVPIANLAFHQDNPDALAVFVDGSEAGATHVITDVEEVATAEYEATYDYRVARGLARRAIKVALVEGTRQGVRAARNEKEKGRDTSGELIDVGLAVIGSLWAAAETADLRCWSLLPASCQSLRLELDPGVHEITVRPARAGTALPASQTIQVHVHANRPTYVMALAPTLTSVAPLLSRELAIATETAAEVGQ